MIGVHIQTRTNDIIAIELLYHNSYEAQKGGEINVPQYTPQKNLFTTHGYSQFFQLILEPRQ